MLSSVSGGILNLDGWEEFTGAHILRRGVGFSAFPDLMAGLMGRLCKMKLATELTWPFLFFLKTEGRHLIIAWVG